MSSLDDLRGKLKGDPTLNVVEVEGESLEECLDKLCKLFNTTKNNVEYEVLDQGSKGLLGMGKKLWKLRGKVLKKEETTIEKKIEKPENVVKDGFADFFIKKDGIFLKVVPPQNNGRKLKFEDIRQLLFEKRITSYNPDLIKDILNQSTGNYEKIGEWRPNPDYDSRIVIDISSDELEAYITVTAPIFSGRIIESDEIKKILEEHGIIYGVMDDKLAKINENKLYNQKILIAKGRLPINGDDAKIEYKFKIHPKETVSLKEDDQGRVNYSELDLVQNVVEGQIVAVKMPPTQGKNGITVTGKETKSSDGKDIPLPIGKNTFASDSGLEIIAQIQGQAILDEDNTVTVEPVYNVEGDVGVKTGKIVFLGSVYVSGNVEDGFSIKATKDIEIKGGVGKCELEAEGNIIVRQGISGKEGGNVRAGGSVYAKYINTARVDATTDVIVLDGILHSYVTAGGRIICNGKKGKIVGGKIVACREINAKELGSVSSNTETKLETGTDPKAKEQLKQYEEERDKKEENLKKLRTNIETLKKFKIAHGGLPADKEAMLKRMMRAEIEFSKQLEEILQDVERLKVYLNDLDAMGKISAKDNVYPGVEITIKNTKLLIKNEFQFVTFIYEAGNIRPVPYQEIEQYKEIEKVFRDDKSKKRR